MEFELSMLPMFVVISVSIISIILAVQVLINIQRTKPLDTPKDSEFIDLNKLKVGQVVTLQPYSEMVEVSRAYAINSRMIKK